MRAYLTLLVCTFFFFGCKKTENAGETQPPVPSTTITLSMAQATPGDIVEIKVNKKIEPKETNISFNGTTVKGYPKNDSTFLFYVPVVVPGSVTVAVPSLAGANTANLTIKSYTAIDNPQVVLNEFLEKRQKSIDSLTKSSNGPLFQASPEVLTLLGQLKEEWDEVIGNLTAKDKELLAYTIQKNMPDPAAHSFNPMPANHYAKENGIKGDVGDKLVATAKEYVTMQNICIGSIPFVVVSGYAFYVAKTPWTTAAFLASFTTFVISRESAIKRAGEVGRLKGVAEAVTADFQKTMKVDFSNNTEKSVKMAVDFRNLASGDAGLQADISTAFSKELQFINEEKEVRDIYNKVSSFLKKLIGPYPSYAAIIGNIPKATMTLDAEGNNILIKGVSDNRISYTTSLSGTTRKVKISSTSSTSFDFNLQVAYKRSLDGKELLKDIACTFKPEEPASLTLVSGNNQSGGINANLANPLVVLVKDVNGQVLSGLTVNWAVTSGGGQISATSTTGSNGQASNTWKLGASGTQTVTASVKKSDGTSVSGSPLTFSAQLASATLIGHSFNSWVCTGCTCDASFNKTGTAKLIVQFDNPPSPNASIQTRTVWNTGGASWDSRSISSLTQINSTTYSFEKGFCWGGPTGDLWNEVRFVDTNGSIGSVIKISISRP